MFRRFFFRVGLQDLVADGFAQVHQFTRQFLKAMASLDLFPIPADLLGPAQAAG